MNNLGSPRIHNATLQGHWSIGSGEDLRAVVSYWRKYVHEVLVNRLGGLSLPRKSVVRLTDRPDMTLDVYRGRKTTNQQQIYKSGEDFLKIFTIYGHGSHLWS